MSATLDIVDRPSRLRRRSSAGVALATVVALWAVAAISPLFSDRASTIRLEERLAPPSAAHPFGTDDLGRDLLARVVVATPVSLAIGLTAAAVSLAVGFAVGASAGWFGARGALQPPAFPDRFPALRSLSCHGDRSQVLPDTWSPSASRGAPGPTLPRHRSRRRGYPATASGRRLMP